MGGVQIIVINPSVCVSVCLSTSISLEPLNLLAWNFVCRFSVAVAQSSGGIALRYVLPLFWMTSRLAVMGATPARVGSTQRRWSITCATGADADVYECLLWKCYALCENSVVQTGRPDFDVLSLVCIENLGQSRYNEMLLALDSFCVAQRVSWDRSLVSYVHTS